LSSIPDPGCFSLIDLFLIIVAVGEIYHLLRNGIGKREIEIRTRKDNVFRKKAFKRAHMLPSTLWRHVFDNSRSFGQAKPFLRKQWFDNTDANISVR
jgi:hypothetical protein